MESTGKDSIQRRWEAFRRGRAASELCEDVLVVKVCFSAVLGSWNGARCSCISSVDISSPVYTVMLLPTPPLVRENGATTKGHTRSFHMCSPKKEESQVRFLELRCVEQPESPSKRGNLSDSLKSPRPTTQRRFPVSVFTQFRPPHPSLRAPLLPRPSPPPSSYQQRSSQSSPQRGSAPTPPSHHHEPLSSSNPS